MSHLKRVTHSRKRDRPNGVNTFVEMRRLFKRLLDCSISLISTSTKHLHVNSSLKIRGQNRASFEPFSNDLRIAQHFASKQTNSILRSDRDFRMFRHSTSFWLASKQKHLIWLLHAILKVPEEGSKNPISTDVFFHGTVCHYITCIALIPLRTNVEYLWATGKRIFTEKCKLFVANCRNWAIK